MDTMMYIIVSCDADAMRKITEMGFLPNRESLYTLEDAIKDYDDGKPWGKVHEKYN